MSATPPREKGGADPISVPQLASSPKADPELGKLCPPGETIRSVSARFGVMEAQGAAILADVRRVDTERLHIPVFLSQGGKEARRLMPERKQMGKGASPEQAEASALMELAERYSYYSFWERLPGISGVVRGTWSEAAGKLGASLISLDEMLASVREPVSPSRSTVARQLFDLLPWTFAPTLHVGENRTIWLPLEWFRLINEFNGCSAGNSMTEAVLQGACELVERHACARVVRESIECPTLTTGSVQDPVLQRLLRNFSREGIQLLLKDCTLDMPVPTVAALAFDPASFPATSELIFTAGTASSPEKAAIRALTEVAQLAGDFCTNSCYEPSGLPKYGNRHESQWLEAGRAMPLTQLPDLSAPDMLNELQALAAGLRKKDVQLYSLDITHPQLRIPAQQCFAPGLDFFQREARDGLGLYIGRRLAEEAPPDAARKGLDVLGKLMPGATYMQFFRGLLLLRQGNPRSAGDQFAVATAMQETPEREGLAAYYSAYSRVLLEDWSGALPWLDRAIAVSPAGSEAWSLRGICRFKLRDFPAAAENFKAALRRNKGSAPDLANLGACYMETGDYEQARACLVTALSLDPDLPPARQRLDALSKNSA